MVGINQVGKVIGVVMNFTKEQQKVIDSRNCNLLVSAAAGSGKTAVLVERIIQRLLSETEKLEIDRLLVVTYTNAAAAEMRERISAAIERKLLENPENTHLQRQQLLLHSASIMTIHSFCVKLLREYFHRLDLDPGFRIADEAELTLLRSDVLSELLEKQYEQGDEAFYHFVECYAGGKSDQIVEEQILRLYQFAESNPWIEQWLEDTKKLLAVTDKKALEEHRCIQELLVLSKRLLSSVLEDTKKAIQICKEPDGPQAYLEALLADQDIIECLLNCNTYEEMLYQMKLVSFVTLSRKRQKCDEEKKEFVKQLRDENKEIIKKLQSEYFFQSVEEMLQDLQVIQAPVSVLLDLTKQYAMEFKKAKRERNILDFSDLEHLVVELLCERTEQGMKPSQVAKEIQTRFDEIMIDEYQDSNLIQDWILSSISKESIEQPNRFMVGDVKQSIYKFRMAKPELFLQKYDTYEEEGSYVRIDLYKNFRSRACILEGINEIFKPIMKKDFGGIEYDNLAALHYGASYKQDTPEHKIEFLMSVGTEDSDISAKEREAHNIAKRIKELVGETSEQETTEENKIEQKNTAFLLQTKDNATQKATYKDITILLRAMNGWADVFLEVLTEEGIPVYADTQSGYFKSKEVQTMLNLLRCLDNPRQDIPLVAVLHSELGNFTNDDFARLRYDKGIEEIEDIEEKIKKKYRKKWYVCLITYKPDEGDEAGVLLKQKIDTFLAWYEELRYKVSFLPVSELLEEIYRKTEYPNMVRVMSLGERRVKNLELLVEKARQFEKSSYTGLFDFIRYIDRLIRYEVDFGEAGIQDNINAVRLMSIHKSKGLEFPIVFLAGMEKKFNTMDSNAKLVLHAELGIGADYIDPEQRIQSTGLFKKIIARKLKEEMLTEEMRVFYVALTRAKEKLILTADFAETGDWEKLLAEQGDAYKERIGATSYLDFLKISFIKLKQQDLIVEKVVKEDDLLVTKVQDLLEQDSKRQELEDLVLSKEYNVELSKEFKKQEEYQYPYTTDCERKGKVTISELKREAYEEAEEVSERMFEELTEYVPTLPKYLQKEERVKGASRGTLYHRIMECLDFTRDYTQKEQIKHAIAELVQKKWIRENTLSVVKIDDFWNFFRSDIGQQMQLAAREGRLKKEQPFVIGIPAKEFDEGEGEEIILVQGILDAYFEEADGLVLVDYKTDWITENTKEELCNRYALQLAYYARALQQITGKQVKKKLIYSFYSRESFSIDT